MQSPPAPALPLLLTGATGTVGLHLVRILLARHARVRILAREPEKVRTIIRFYTGCILTPAQASALLPKSELIEVVECVARPCSLVG